MCPGSNKTVFTKTVGGESNLALWCICQLLLCTMCLKIIMETKVMVSTNKEVDFSGYSSAKYWLLARHFILRMWNSNEI
jgi:hypothetical protein